MTQQRNISGVAEPNNGHQRWSRTLLTLIFICLSVSSYATHDLIWGLQQMPYGDTDIDSVNIEEFYQEHYVVLTKNIEICRQDESFTYYNLFAPKQKNDSVYIIYKLQVRIPRTMKFLHGKYTYSGNTYFYFGHEQKRFAVFPNIEETESESQEAEVYSVFQIEKPRWALLHSSIVTKEELAPGCKAGFYQTGNHVVCFSNIQKEDTDLYIECMKNIEVVSYREVLMTGLCHTSQPPSMLNKIDSAKYSCAYKYIKNNTTAKRIKVSRCIVDLDRWVFPFDSLADLPKEKNALMAFVERKKNGRNKDCFSNEIAALTFDVKKPQNILYFSQIEDNMLVACLLPFDKHRHRIKDIDRFDIICRFNESENYLFVFDDNNIIQKVIKVVVNYE